MLYSNGDRYEGDIVEGKKHGVGNNLIIIIISLLNYCNI